MEEITLTSFVNGLGQSLDDEDCRLVWFFGAGCSISSGIPGASDLVKAWLPQLAKREAGDDDWEAWAAKNISEFGSAPLGRHYGEVINKLFRLETLRQTEIERLTTNSDPAVGYALFAMLATHPTFGPRSNAVLTTNFDDLVADSVYLLTRQKPLVIAHENLGAFARASRRRPLVVKLHGDARLAPKNTAEETQTLADQLHEPVLELLRGAGLVFCGYEGNDQSIAAALSAVPASSLTHGVYWVGDEVPDTPVGRWFKGRADSYHVRHRDFDQLFIRIASKLDLQLPGADRLTKLFTDWEKALRHETAANPGTEESLASDGLRTKLNVWRLARKAEALSSAGDSDRASELYERALIADPNNPGILGNYAIFLTATSQKHDRAQELYERALAADPNNATTLTNYAIFLTETRHDHDRAQELFERALTANPNDANALTNYAIFLKNIRHERDRAQELFERALTADPNDPNTLGNYADFLYWLARDDEALRYVDESLALPVLPASEVEVSFLALAADPIGHAGVGGRLYRALVDGTRSPGWDFGTTLGRLADAGDPRLSFFQALAAVISDGAGIETLDEFPEWAQLAEPSHDQRAPSAKRPRQESKRSR